jgi:Holliday junction DNA helicase RuvA
MIAHLSGTVLSAHQSYLVLDVHGVGYKVFCTERTMDAAPPQSDLSLNIRTVVREDALDLFGFPTRDELELFELLLGVSGIGPRSALGIINLESIERLTGAIARGDVGYLTKVSGVGKKSAEKIVLELKDKVSVLALDTIHEAQQDDEDVLEALKALGYRADEAREVLHKIPSDITEPSARVKEALRILSHA